MKISPKYIVLIVVGLAALIALSGAVYTVDETQQVIITRFGKPMGVAITRAGIKFKVPFIDHASYFEKRILNWDGDPNQIPTKDKRYIWVDVTARWRIVDPLLFFESVGDERVALTRIDDVIDGETRNSVTAHNLLEMVRTSNREMVAEEGILEMEREILEQKVEFGREAITRDIIDNASKKLERFGMELVDVRIKRINYVEEVRQKVFERMISERKRIAEKYRSEGKGQKAEIEGKMEKELLKITSGAYRKAQVLIGNADAEATRIYADAYNRDPEFYSFVQTLDTYKITLDEESWLLMSTDSDYFKYLKNLK